ncbi:MAG: two-component sensor histidine kinase, partial [Desulfatitalea sp.]|nr:two-component sensor histidine kinase [Desulfatitalea sp.]
MSAEESKSDSRSIAYSGLRYRMAIIVILVSLAPMVLVSGIILYQFHIFSNEMVHAHLGELVLKHKQNIDYFLKQKLNDISHLSRSFDLSELQDKQFLQERLRILQEEYSFVFVDLGLIDETGRQMAYAGPFELQRADYSNAEWFKRAILTHGYVSDVFLGLRGHPHFIVTIKRNWGGRPWLLRATIDFVAFNTLVENLTVGKTGTAFILNRQGEFQTRPPRGEPELTKQQYMNLFKKGDDALRSAQPGGGSGFLLEDGDIFLDGYIDRYTAPSSVFTFEKLGERGGKFIIVAAFLKNNQWMLIFQQETADAFEKLKGTQAVAGMIAFVGAVAIIAVAFIVAGRMVKRMARLDFEKEMMNQQVIETGKLASVGELAAGIAHEINNPVAIMVEEAGWIQDLMQEGISKEGNLEEFKRALQQIETQGRRCKEITHKLLSFARKTDSRIQTLELNELITEVVDLLSQKSRYANVEVQVELAQDLPLIQASTTEMQQVLMNILHNAVDAMEKSGGKIVVRSQAETDHIRLSISDNGPGIPASNLGRLFDPFFTTKPVGKGTGLGLSICYGII